VAKKVDKVKVLLAVALVLALAVIFNPSPERHRERIKQVVSERNAANKIFGMGLLAAFASKYHNFYFGSYTTVDDKVQSVGLFGVVFVKE